MYTKDKNTRITLRLNEPQFAFVKSCADSLDVNPSTFLRIIINAAMAQARKDKGTVVDELREASSLYASCADNLEGDGRENDKADINDCL